MLLIWSQKRYDLRHKALLKTIKVDCLSCAQREIRVPIKFKRFPCRESNPGHGGENARSSPLDHMGILGYVGIQFPSMKAGRRRTFIAKIIGEFNFTNILRWRGIEPRLPRGRREFYH